MNPRSEAGEPQVNELRERIHELEQQMAQYHSLIRRLEARDNVTRILVESSSLEEAAPRTLKSLCDLLDWDVGVLWLLDEGGSVLRPGYFWSARPVPRFAADTMQRTFPMGVGLPGRVWLDQEPSWILDLSRDDNYLRHQAASIDGLFCGFAFPITARTDIAGVVELYGAQPRESDQLLIEASVIIGHQIGLFLQRRRAEAQLERRARISALRADAAAALSKQGELNAILRECTDAVVRHLGVAFARIWTTNAAERTLQLQASSGLYTHTDGAHSRIPIGAFKIGWIAEKKHAHVTNAVPDDPRVTDHNWARREGMQAFAGYPLVVEDRVMGVLAMFSRERMEQVVLDELAPIADAIAQFLDRRRSEDELRQAEALTLGILNTALDAVIAINQAGRILEFNPAAESLFGYPRARAIGQHVAELIIPPVYRDAHHAGMARYLSTGESRILGRRLELKAMRADRSEFPVELSVARIPGAGPPVFTAYIRALPEP
jgi:PAS domain S-box-containing protein